MDKSFSDPSHPFGVTRLCPSFTLLPRGTVLFGVPSLLPPFSRIFPRKFRGTQNGNPLCFFDVSHEAISFLEKVVIARWHVGNRRLDLCHKQRQLVFFKPSLRFAGKRIKISNRSRISNPRFSGHSGEIYAAGCMTGGAADGFIAFIVKDNDG